MKYYSVEKVNNRVTAIRSLTGELMYLLEGGEKAVLIDTCLGVGHLKDLVQSLTAKPLTVLLTHGHIDHALGAPEFEQVYMNLKDLELYRMQSPLSERKGYMKNGLAPEVWAQVTESDFVPPQPDKDFLPLEDGMRFELGGLTIEAIAYPGHTQGSMAFLIEEERILILGDACNNSTFLFGPESSSVEEYREATLVVQEKTEGRFNRVFLSHQVMDTGVEIMGNMVKLCEEIMAGKTDDAPFEFMGMKAFVAKRCNERFEREDGECGNLVYRKL